MEAQAQEVKTETAAEVLPKAVPLGNVFGSEPSSEATGEESPSLPKEEVKEPVQTDEEKPKEAEAEPEPEKKPEEAKTPSEVEALKAELKKISKQYEDTRNWATQVNQQKVEMERQFNVINKKLDGTYDPEKDERPAATTEQIASMAELQGRIKASEAAAREKFGDEAVDKYLADFDAKYKDNASIQTHVLLSPSPVMEGIKVLENEKWKEKWGNDPETIEKRIREASLKEFEAKIDEMVNKKMKERLGLVEKQVTTVGDARGSDSQKPSNNPIPLSKLFG